MEFLHQTLIPFILSLFIMGPAYAVNLNCGKFYEPELYIVPIQKGASDVFKFTPPAGSHGFQIEVWGSSDQYYLINSLINAGNKSLVDQQAPQKIATDMGSIAQDLAFDTKFFNGRETEMVGPYLSPIRSQIGIGDGYVSLFVPPEAYNGKASGTFKMQIKSYGKEKSQDYVRIRLIPRLPLKINAPAKLKLKLISTKKMNLDPNSEFYKYMIEHLQKIFQQANIRIDVESLANLDPAIADIQDTAAITRIFNFESDRVDGMQLRLFAVEKLLVEGIDAAGYSHGIPGPSSLEGLKKAGALLSFDRAPDPTADQNFQMSSAIQIANIFAHEVFHYLGLSHTFELRNSLTDQFKDTPKEESENIMNPEVPRGGVPSLTTEQIQLLRLHPLVQAL